MRTASIVAFALSLTSSSCFCRHPHDNFGLQENGSPAWTVKLPAAAIEQSPILIPGAYEADHQMAFGSNDELVVIEDTGPFDRPKHVRAFVLAAQTGRIMAEQKWDAGQWA